jgi:hypothetical protein
MPDGSIGNEGAEASLQGPGMDGSSMSEGLFPSLRKLSMLIGAKATWLFTASSQLIGRPAASEGWGRVATAAAMGVRRGPAGAAAAIARGRGAAARPGTASDAPSEGIFIRPPQFLHRPARPANRSSTSKGAAHVGHSK